MLEYEKIRQISLIMESVFNGYPEVVVVLGSGLDYFSQKLEPLAEVSYSDIPYMYQSSVKTHQGRLLLGRLNGKVVAVMRGRIHIYEGYEPADVVRLLRVMILWGARRVFLTNAAGGIDPSLNPGDLMLIDDQINNIGCSSLTGFNDERMGVRFPDMTNLYNDEAAQELLDAAKKLGIKLHRGVYVGMHGPAFETPAEINMLRILGGDAVGMSTVLEAEAASHMGAIVSGISCISNHAASKGGKKITHEEVSEAVKGGSENLANLLAAVI